MIAVIVLAALLAALLAAFLLFYRHSKTPEWGDSEVRKSALRMLVAIAPLWGMRYQEPHHELPTLSTPGDDPEPLPIRAQDAPGPPAPRLR